MSKRDRGFTLLEVLIALFVLAFGLLSLARVLAKASLTEMEAVQRTQAMAIAQDIVDRINLNRKSAATYVGEYVGYGPLEDCAAAGTPVEQDQCAWRNLLRGGTTIDAGKPIGAPIAARACVTNPAPNIYLVAVAWQGLVTTGAPDSDCGEGAYGAEEVRRVYSTVVQVATLGT